jgi:nucleotide-binding universal stress UspA family protein
MTEILVAIDGSPHSRKILQEAANLAKSLQAKVVPLHVIPDSHIPEEYEKYAKAEGIDPTAYLASLTKQIIRDAETQLQSSGVQSEGLGLSGNPAEVIVKTARSRGSMMIILGVQGLHGIGRMRALGSISRSVIESSDVPVLAVP